MNPAGLFSYYCLERSMKLITYTTKYRLGGLQFKRVAEHLAAGLEGPVRCVAVESKKDLKQQFHEILEAGNEIDEFHFIGHSGMYGPMFGSVGYPEQFSPHEWKELQIPFAHGATAYFHCCRSARWFANFFADVFKVRTAGYHWYTTFSARKDRFKYDWKKEGPLYSIGCPGRKSHGLMGSVRKYLGGVAAEKWKFFDPEEASIERSYDEVAALYDDVFQDIRVRRDEWNWLTRHLQNSRSATVLDIGCGNGALLRALEHRIGEGIGVDVSKGLIDHANGHGHGGALSFHHIDGPALPLDVDSVDVVVSMLSFRYLDWDPIMHEIKRVLRPGGRFLVLDMVAAPVSISEYPKLIRCKMANFNQRKRDQRYAASLQKLVEHPAWKEMLKHNPMRSQHEMKWYLESRFPGQRSEIINVGWNSRILAFDSGDFSRVRNLDLSFP